MSTHNVQFLNRGVHCAVSYVRCGWRSRQVAAVSVLTGRHVTFQCRCLTAAYRDVDQFELMHPSVAGIPLLAAYVIIASTNNPCPCSLLLILPVLCLTRQQCTVELAVVLSCYRIDIFSCDQVSDINPGAGV